LNELVGDFLVIK